MFLGLHRKELTAPVRACCARIPDALVSKEETLFLWSRGLFVCALFTTRKPIDCHGTFFAPFNSGRSARVTGWSLRSARLDLQAPPMACRGMSMRG